MKAHLGKINAKGLYFSLCGGVAAVSVVLAAADVVRYALLGDLTTVAAVVALGISLCLLCFAAWLGRCPLIFIAVAVAAGVLAFFTNGGGATAFNFTLYILAAVSAVGGVVGTALCIAAKVPPRRLAAIIVAPVLLFVAIFGGVWGGCTLSADGRLYVRPEVWSVPDKYDKVACPQQGRLEKLDYVTRAYATDGRQVTKSAYVYLPYGYDPNNSYDILYLLHGTGDDEEYWLKTYSYNKVMLDNLIYYGDIQPMIVVTPTFYVEDDCADDLDRLTYSFKDELRNDLMPAAEGRYSTYAPDCTPEGFASSRTHRAFAGLSRGGVTVLHSGICGSLDYFSWFGTFSGSRTDGQYFADTAGSGEFASLDIDYWYVSSGMFDFALAGQLSDYRDILSVESRLKEGVNTSFDVFPVRYHSMGNWHLALYNFLQKIF